MIHKRMSIQRRSNGNRGRQSTLLGLWKQSKGGEIEESVSAGAKTKRKHGDLLSQTSSQDSSQNDVAPPLRLHGNSGQPHWQNISIPNGPMLLLRECIGGKKSSERKATREALKTQLSGWNDNVTFQIYGKECKIRRRICQFSIGGKLSYSYSGLSCAVAPEFPQILYDIKRRVEDLICEHILALTNNDALESKKNLSIPSEFVDMTKNRNSDEGKEIFNYCLCNHYRKGEEYMGYHSDDESSLDPHAPIASVSLGASRNFDIRPKKKANGSEKRSRVTRICLGDGDLLLMIHPMQSHYEHAIPVEKRITGERINLTFRRLLTS